MKRLFIFCVSVACLFSCKSGASIRDEVILFAGAYSTGEDPCISVFNFNQKDGSLIFLNDIRGENIQNPSYLVVSEDNKYVYSVNETLEGAVSAFLFDGKTNTLKYLNSQPTNGAHPCFINADNTGKFIVTANYSGGSITVFPLSDDGTIEPLCRLVDFNAISEPASRLHTVQFSPDGRYLFATDLGKDLIYRFTINADNIKTLISGNYTVATALTAGSGPRHLTFHPSGKFLYCIDELSGMVDALKYSANDGQLTAIQAVASDTTTVSPRKGSADIHISPDGRFLYSSNRLQNDGIAIFEIDVTSGMLTKVGEQKTDIHPRNFIISPNGKYLLCACSHSNSIQVFERDENTGLLHLIATDYSIAKPVCLKWGWK
ncbi:MAG: lactonase family protein [Dysgonamonadaceae bacterium]|jgi:6-phosphogluconolactonase (cycloisomerase 2 family)|nr:lactonase family protein [Dysgonamonadaceae bacterium]